MTQVPSKRVCLGVALAAVVAWGVVPGAQDHAPAPREGSAAGRRLGGQPRSHGRPAARPARSWRSRRRARHPTARSHLRARRRDLPSRRAAAVRPRLHHRPQGAGAQVRVDGRHRRCGSGRPRQRDLRGVGGRKEGRRLGPHEGRRRAEAARRGSEGRQHTRARGHRRQRRHRQRQCRLGRGAHHHGTRFSRAARRRGAAGRTGAAHRLQPHGRAGTQLPAHHRAPHRAGRSCS